MAAITISRQLGSLGTQIARDVAQRLGYRLVWREVINEAARRADAPEMALAMIDDLGLLGLRPCLESRRTYRQAVRAVMDDLIAEGNVVIVGQACRIILGERPDVLHVRITAPLASRVERIAAMQNITATAAKARVEQSDRTRRDYLRRCYRVHWDDPDLYDLVLSTERLTIEAAADLVCQALTRCLQSSDPGTLGKGERGLG